MGRGNLRPADDGAALLVGWILPRDSEHARTNAHTWLRRPKMGALFVRRPWMPHGPSKLHGHR